MTTVSRSNTKLNSVYAFIDRLADFSLLFLLCIITSHDGIVKGENYLYYVAFFLFVGVMFIRALLKNTLNFSRLLIPINTIWYGLLIILSLTSVFWATSQAAVMEMISRMTQNLILGYFLTLNITDRKEFRRVENIFVISTVYLTFRILLTTPVDEWFSRFLGNDITGHNVNSTAFYLSISVLILFYRFYVEKKRYVFPILALLSFMIVLTSSRKSLLMIIIGFFLVILLDKQKGGRFLKITLAILAVLIFAYFMFTNEKLYRAIGWKFESIFTFLENGSGDNSLFERKFFREYAAELFLENPVFGVGLNNFSTHLGIVFTRETYAHNNWLEMLSCLGVVGFATYYWFYAYCIVKLYNQVRRNISFAIPYLTLFVCMVIVEYSMVVYYDTFIQLSITLFYLGMSLNDKRSSVSRLGGNKNGLQR